MKVSSNSDTGTNINSAQVLGNWKARPIIHISSSQHPMSISTPSQG